MVNPAFQNFMGVANQYGNSPLKDLVDNLKKASSALNKTPLADLDKFIDVLLGKKNGIGAFFLFSAKTKAGAEALLDVKLFVHQGEHILETIKTSEVEYVINELPTAFITFTTALIENNISLFGIRLIQKAINKISPENKRCLTNLHAALFGLCLKANRFDPVLEYLNLDASTLFNNTFNGVVYDPLNILLYFYYGGLIYLALEKYEEAAFYLEQCVCLPAVSASAIMVEALKKLTMVNLMLGRKIQLPAYRSAAIQRASQSKCSIYFSLAVLFNDLCSKEKSKKVHRSFSALISKNETQLVNDKNYGLTQKINEQITVNKALQLPSIFTKLKLSDVSTYLDIESGNSLEVLIKLIEKGDIPGKIDLMTESIDFEQSPPHPYDLNYLEEAMNNSIILANLLPKIHQDVNMHPLYLQRTGKKGSQASSTINIEDEGIITHSIST